MSALSRSLSSSLKKSRSLFTAARAFSSSAADASASSFPSWMLEAPASEVTTLSNGLRVASEGGHGETATVGVWIDAGSRYETAANNGVAHFLEHMAFKGTSKRSQHELEVEIENMGAHLNAYTSREQTVYYAKVFKDDIAQSMDILSDILLNSVYDPAAIDREREVILREMEEVNKMDEETIFDRLHETAYQDCGLGRTILGSKENIMSMSQDQLRDYVHTHYTAPRVVVAGAGAVDHSQLAELADKHFGSLASASTTGSSGSLDDKAVFTGSDIRITDVSHKLAHVALAFEVPGWTSPRIPSHGDADAPRVMEPHQWCCQQHGVEAVQPRVADEELAHSVMTFNTSYVDTGLFGVYATAEDLKLNDLMWTTMEAMVRLCHDVTDEEVDRAKANLKASMLYQLEGSSGVCEDIGRQMLTYGRRISIPETFSRIDAVDASSVRATASTYINDQELALAAHGPIHELPDYAWLRRHTYWLRK